VWKEVAVRLAARTMPPKPRPEPSAEERKTIAAWLDERQVAADLARQKVEGRAVLRRLNRVEYNNTLRDLLAIDVDLRDLLPEDESVDGFDNVGAALTISPVLMERYLEAADAALNAAIVKGPRPETINARYTYKGETTIAQRIGYNIALRDEVAILYTSTPAWLRKVRPSVRGRYRFRICAHAESSESRPLLMQVSSVGPSAIGGYFEVPAEKSKVVEFESVLGPRDIFQIGACGLTSQYIRNLSAYKGPGLAIEWVEFEGPLYDRWPPESHRRVLGDADPKTAKLADAERLLRDFVPRAFRRSVSDEQLKPYIDLVRSRLEKGYSFEEALRAARRSRPRRPTLLLSLEIDAGPGAARSGPREKT
jgi:hypothetical protein